MLIPLRCLGAAELRAEVLLCGGVGGVRRAPVRGHRPRERCANPGIFPGTFRRVSRDFAVI